MRNILKWICLFALALGFCLLPKFSGEDETEFQTVQPAQLVQPGYTVVLNRYAPEEWNGGYGHYDLSFIAPPGQLIRCRLGEGSVDCGEITLSYGATDGDLSPARVHLYTAARSDHLPAERLMIYDGLQPADFNAFMAWFTNDFSLYSKEAEGRHAFAVAEDGYAVYSLEANKNCLTAAIRMALAIPGIRDAQVNPCAGLVERLVMGMKL